MRAFKIAGLWLCVVVSTSIVLPVSAEDVLTVRDGQLPVLEPAYKQTPRYALLLLGADGGSSVWIVEDGRRLYVDRNANRDLTDDGPPIAAINRREFMGSSGLHWDMDYVLDEFVLPDGSRQTDFQLRHWNYGDPEDSYGLSLTLNGRVPMYAGWNTLLKATAREASVVHFGRSVAPRKLRFKEFVPGAKLDRFSITFTNPDISRRTDARLSIDALPDSVHPSVLIDWPVATGAPSLRTVHELTQRCCYWEFYTEDFSVPERVVSGTARVTVNVPHEAFPLELSRDEFEVPVVLSH